VRHKILDIIGDIYLLNRPILGKVIAKQTGHIENIALVKEPKRTLSVAPSRLRTQIMKIMLTNTKLATYPLRLLIPVFNARGRPPVRVKGCVKKVVQLTHETLPAGFILMLEYIFKKRNQFSQFVFG
jgi:hypothetical protein